MSNKRVMDPYKSLQDWKDEPKKQSGMEKKHEEWVLQTLNFLSTMEIPFYTYKPNGDRDPKADKDIPERLKLMRGKHLNLVTRAGDLQSEIYREQRQVRELKQKLAEQKTIVTKAHTALAPDTGEPRPGEAIMLLDGLIDHPEEEEKNSDDGNPQPV